MPVIGLCGPLEFCQKVFVILCHKFNYELSLYSKKHKECKEINALLCQEPSWYEDIEEAEYHWLRRPSSHFIVTLVDREDSAALNSFSSRTLFILISLKSLTDPTDPIIDKQAAFSLIFDVEPERQDIQLDRLLTKLCLNKITWFRPDWDSYFMQIAKLAASRSNCCKRPIGCVLVNNSTVIATGYNGTPRNMVNCFDGGCMRCAGPSRCGTDLATCLCLHAEENALLEAGRSRAVGSTLYCTTAPCLQCTKKIVQCGVKRVIFAEEYSQEHDCRLIMQQAGVAFEKFIYAERLYLLSSAVE